MIPGTPGARNDPAIEQLVATAYRIPTDSPEADGTISWDSTTMVVVEVEAAGKTGLGYTYAHAAAREIINDLFRPLVVGTPALDNSVTWATLRRQSRNVGCPGLVSMAISAVDTALWDLKARLLQVPLATLLSPLRHAVAIYGSGGFTTYSEARLGQQLASWVEQGIPHVKMKVGSDPGRDVARVQAARRAIGEAAELFVDANGAYSRKAALRFAAEFGALGVTWFEEPVSMEDGDGLRLLRDRAPPGMDIAAGEYGFDLDDFVRLTRAGAVDVLQADVTRCQGITGFLRVAASCEAEHLPLSTHCAPALHLHAACAAPRLRHMEWFHDHVRIEQLLFEGSPRPRHGLIAPDFSRPGNGLTFKRSDAERFLI